VQHFTPQTKGPGIQRRQLKQQFGSCRFYNNEEAEIGIREWLRTQEPDVYRNGIFKFVPGWDSNEEMEMAVREWMQIQEPDRTFKLVPRRDKCIKVFGEPAEK
jgi:hypothetical protein